MEQFRRGDVMLLSKKTRYFLSVVSLLICLMISYTPVLAQEDIDYSSLMGEETTEDPNQEYYLDKRLSETEVNKQVSTYAQMLAQLTTFSDDEFAYIEKQYKDQAGYEGIFEACRKLSEDELGKFRSYENISVEETGKNEVKVLFDLVFEKKTEPMILKLNVFDNIGVVLKSISVSEENAENIPIGDKLAEAGANTLMGMGTVFAVLIFISLIISCFKFIPEITAKVNKKTAEKSYAAKNDKKQSKDLQPVVQNVEQPDNSELVAVIAAAIAASENVSTDSFVVRSIRRRY